MSITNETVKLYAVVVPAGGSSRRMYSASSKENKGVSKQFLSIAGRTLLQHAIDPFLSDPDCQSIVICVPDSDIEKTHNLFNDPRINVIKGGPTRSQSVKKGLQAVSQDFNKDYWVMVHDAARANLYFSDLQKLKQQITAEYDGGILAKPAQDTLKRQLSKQKIATLDRSEIWHAMTPQMFRLGALINAMHEAAKAKIEITDESAAMEIAGASVILVRGRADNVKLTYPEDLSVVERLLEKK